MKATNRAMNRTVLLLVGVVALVAGAVAIAAAVLAVGNPPVWLQRSAAAAEGTWHRAAGWSWDVPSVGTVAVLPVLAAAAAVLLTVLLVVFLCTRRSGRTGAVLEVDGVDGRTTVDLSVAEAVLTDPLLRRAEVLAARASAYRVGKVRAVELAVIVRPSASLGEVVAAAENAVREWDRLLGVRVPIMLHLSDRRWRDALRSPSRVT